MRHPACLVLTAAPPRCVLDSNARPIGIKLVCLPEELNKNDNPPRLRQWENNGGPSQTDERFVSSSISAACALALPTALLIDALPCSCR
ncbi:hypothetical protein K504DRAFT_464789 [Pleomassaria siparia CBS 279.74]|uniref:Uncharacterized protein n=1 Tax=Pleomassaria siparia CBS 279.74 TaxID=1314801 RepID=A0A6G1KIJ7_9PLEO|nr:hypothetical protein K504DRAFT_464789 [Pleomassaria siparia CBS 279.74]